MFFKVSDAPERYINTDRIELIDFITQSAGRAQACTIYFTSKQSLIISDSAGRALLEFAHTNTAYDESIDDNKNMPSLKTHIAQLLRDSLTGGANTTDLLSLNLTENPADFYRVLQELLEEHVIFADPERAIYYHALHAPPELKQPQ